ncbi:MAG: LysM peptidoglycan-binding domain-containing protein [Paludibacteraceae bacterium]|nr:LysM peptidoglycan-binding domain-containing protein [Paludibacteraceae bacterium]
MKKNIFCLLTIIILSLTSFSIGQNNSYPIKKVNGIEYYVYTVQSGDGLFAISRKFGIAPEEITKVNPEIQKGLKSGQKILIPVQKNVQENIQENQDASRKLKNELSALEQKYFEENQKNLHQQTESSFPSTTLFIQHKVEKNQTLFGISKKYNVSEEEILKYNPQAEEVIHEGDVLYIPYKTTQNGEKLKEDSIKVNIPDKKNELTESPLSSKDKTKFIKHLVKPNETLYSISRMYNVTVDDILKLNPDAFPILKTDTELIIPTSILQNDSVQSAKPINNEIDSALQNNENAEVPTVQTSEYDIKIAFLLPFNLDSPSQQSANGRFKDFYAGSLLAIKKAKENNYSIEIFTYDTEKSDEKLKEILAKPEMKSLDLIVGPAYSDQISLMSDFAKENKINVLIPFSSKVYEISVNPYLFQFNPNDTQIEMDFLVKRIIQKTFRNTNIVFVNIPGVSVLDEGNLFMDRLKIRLQKEHQKFSELNFDATEKTNISKIFKKNQKNLVFFNTDNSSIITPFLKELYVYIDEYDMTLYQEYGWENRQIERFDRIYVAPFKPDLDSIALEEYQETFQKFYDWEVESERPRYDLLGYDLMNCFISVLKNNGKNLIHKLNEINFDNGLQSDFHFKKQSQFSGYINDKLYMGERKAK